MGSHARAFALQVGEGAGSGSWERRAATALALTEGTGSHMRRIALQDPLSETGSWERRAVGPADGENGPWGRQLAERLLPFDHGRSNAAESSDTATATATHAVKGAAAKTEAADTATGTFTKT